MVKKRVDGEEDGVVARAGHASFLTRSDEGETSVTDKRFEKKAEPMLDKSSLCERQSVERRKYTGMLVEEEPRTDINRTN